MIVVEGCLRPRNARNEDGTETVVEIETLRQRNHATYRQALCAICADSYASVSSSGGWTAEDVSVRTYGYFIRELAVGRKIQLPHLG